MFTELNCATQRLWFLKLKFKIAIAVSNWTSNNFYHNMIHINGPSNPTKPVWACRKTFRKNWRMSFGMIHDNDYIHYCIRSSCTVIRTDLRFTILNKQDNQPTYSRQPDGVNKTYANRT